MITPRGSMGNVLWLAVVRHALGWHDNLDVERVLKRADSRALLADEG